MNEPQIVYDKFFWPVTDGEIIARYHEASVEIVQVNYRTDTAKRVYVPYAILDSIMEHSKR